MNIGDMVVCLANEWDRTHPFRHLVKQFPVKGSIYTIRDMINYHPHMENWIGLIFEEIVNPTHLDGVLGGMTEFNFHSVLFRPVKKTNIDIFKEIAVNPPPLWKIRINEKYGSVV